MNNTPIMVEVEMSTKVHTFPGQFIGKINPLDYHIPKEIHNSKPVSEVLKWIYRFDCYG